MKNAFNTIFILISLNAYSQEDSISIQSHVNEIYTIVFNEYINGMQQPNLRDKETTVVVRQQPKYFTKVEDYMVDRLEKKYKNLQKESFNAFLSELGNPVHLNLSIPCFKIYVFNEFDFPTWDELNKNYDNWDRCIYELTPIGFNSDYNQAILYFGYLQGETNGGGSFLIFEKKGKKWKLKSTIGIWDA